MLIGGLGLGFTLKKVLEMLGPAAEVTVAELIPEVTAWNRQFLRGVNGDLLDDGRVELLHEDIFATIGNIAGGRYDAILMDVDNGPAGFVQGKNSYLYDRKGCSRFAHALQPDGRAAFWSASEDRPFAARLHRAGFTVEVHEAKAHESARRFAHRIYVARLPGPQPRKRPTSS